MAEESQIQIKSIEVTNFKSLVDFRLPLEKISCLIGLNGVGKSTVLQFIDFLSQLVRGEVQHWLDERQWDAGDLRSKLTGKRNIEFCIRFQTQHGKAAGRWEAHFSPFEMRCTWERLDLYDFVIEATKEYVQILTDIQHPDRSKLRKNKMDIAFEYQGSILSSLKEDMLSESALGCKHFFQGIESLDMLTPERLRQKTRIAEGTLGSGGRNLSAFVYELGIDGRTRLSKTLRKAYPELIRIYAKSLRSGWKQLEAIERFDELKLRTEARHVNDGLLRLIAIMAEISSKHQFVLFDEIENGINPELIEFIISKLIKAKQQVLVTTHSPMILNYLDDETAKKSVIYLYKTNQGKSRAIPFFSIPSLKEKLRVMGPGEAFVDTNLTELVSELSEISEEEQ